MHTLRSTILYKNIFLRRFFIFFGFIPQLKCSLIPVSAEYWDSFQDSSWRVHNSGSTGWIQFVKPETQAHWLGQFSFKLVQPCDRGLHGTECDVAFPKINHHSYAGALQGRRDNFFFSIVVGQQLAFAIVREAPRQRVFPKGAVVVLALDALVGHGDVPVSLGLHLPDVGASGEAPLGEDLRGFFKAAFTAGIVQPGFHSLCCSEVSGDSKEWTGCVHVQDVNCWETDNLGLHRLFWS